MARSTVASVSTPTVDYAHLPGEEHNPLMESTLHVDWSVVLLNAARHTLADTDHLVTGNVPVVLGDGQPHTAPDIMVIPHARGREFGRYEVGVDGLVPTACVEILSPSNTKAQIRRRCERMLNAGVVEVYVLDPIRETVVRVEAGDDGELHETSALGTYSTGLALTFTRSDGHLAVCCPAGRTVRPGDDPFGWLAAEMNRADAAELQLDNTRAELDTAQAELNGAQAELDSALARIAELEARLSGS